MQLATKSPTSFVPNWESTFKSTVTTLLSMAFSTAARALDSVVSPKCSNNKATDSIDAIGLAIFCLWLRYNIRVRLYIFYRRCGNRQNDCQSCSWVFNSHCPGTGWESPCIVDKQVDIETAAKRITWGKFLNGGQTCVAPDYLLLHDAVKKILQSIC